jgi:hypothetical protein
MTGPRTSAEALAHIQEAARADRVDFAPDVLTRQYDAEIQEIFVALRLCLGKPPRRPMWVADGQQIGVVLEWATEGDDESGYSTESIAACLEVGERLGIALTPHSIWEEAASQLRRNRGAR